MTRYFDVDVYRHEDEDGGALWWSAEVGLDGESVGVEIEPVQELFELLDAVHDEMIPWRRRMPNLKAHWRAGREPATAFLAAVEAAGLTLP